MLLGYDNSTCTGVVFPGSVMGMQRIVNDDLISFISLPGNEMSLKLLREKHQ